MEQFAKETLPVSLESEMRHSYLDYAMSVIVGRALPDVRDGLKPVHRRVLYAMYESNIAWNRPYVKCARVVGDVMRQLEAGLEAIGVGFTPSHANFLLVHVGDGGRVYERLLEQGVIVRPVANYALPAHLRVTVGLPAENERFLRALAVALRR